MATATATGQGPGGGLVITGVGMMSSLGGVVGGCAAARAGLQRIRDLGLVEEDPIALELVPITGHPCGIPSIGFSEVGRVVRLGSLGIADLLRQHPLDDDEMGRSAVLIALGSAFYHEQARAFEEAHPDPEAEPDELPVEPFDYPSDLYDSVVPKTLACAGVRSVPGHSQLFFSDELGLVETLDAAESLLASGQVDRCIVGGIGTLIDWPWLEACLTLGVVKTPDQPHGFIPGEAAAFAIVERSNHPRADSRPALATIWNRVRQRESTHRFSDEKPKGFVMAEVLARSCQGVEDRKPTLYTSINGDVARSQELGLALVRLQETPAAFDRMLHAADPFGHTGAAHGFLGVCLAVRSFVRRYATSDAAVVSAAADSTERAVVTLLGSDAA